MDSFNVSTHNTTSGTTRRVPIQKHDSLHGSHPAWTLSSEHRHAMIAEAAYYLAEKTGFNPDLTERCWLEAEKQIDSQFGGHAH